MADNVDDILKEIRARKKAKKDGGSVSGLDVKEKSYSISRPVNPKIVRLDAHRDLCELVSRVEGKNNG